MQQMIATRPPKTLRSSPDYTAFYLLLNIGFILFFIVFSQTIDANQTKQTVDDTVAPWFKATKIDTPNRPVIDAPKGSRSVNKIQYDNILRRTVRDSKSKNKQVSNDLWLQIPKGFALSGYEQSRVDAELNWYARNQAYLDRVTQRATPFMYFILQQLKLRKMPTEIALLPIVESAFQAFAYSPSSASGLWQFIPATGKHYGLRQNWWYDGRRDIHAATIAALDFLNDLHKRYTGDWLLALAAYNSGLGTVNRAIRKNRKDNKPTDFWSLNLPKETRDYVPRLLAISALVAEPKAYGVHLKPIPGKPYFEKINVGHQIDLALAARLADISIDELFSLNPAFNRWATPPGGPHYLLVPVVSVHYFKEGLAELNSKGRTNWIRHRVLKGELLSEIATRYATTMALLQEINNLMGRKIHPGTDLTIPVTGKIQKGKGTKVKYTVKPGDTIWGLARKYKVKVGDLEAWNSMSRQSTLVSGRKLVLWITIPERKNTPASYVVPAD
jgi:membrane-bound lytic murein transglycosylase D